MIQRLFTLLPPALVGFGGLTLLKVVGGLVVLKITAAQLGPDAFGQLGQLLTLVGIITTFAGGGTQQALIQQLAAAEHASGRQRVLSAQLRIYGVVGLCISVVLVCASQQLSSFLLQRDDLAWLFLLLAATQWLVGGSTMVQAWFSAMQRVKLIFITQGVGVVLGATVFGLLVWKLGYLGAALGLVLYPACSALAGLGIGLLVLGGQGAPRLVANSRKDITSLLSFTAVVIVTIAAVPVAQLHVRDLLGDAMGWTVVGYWQSVLKISDVYIQFFAMVMIYYVLPRFAAKRTLATLDAEFHRAQRTLLALMVLGLTLLFALRHLLLQLFFSPAFLPAEAYFLPQILGDLVRVMALTYVYYSMARGGRAIPILFELLQAMALVVLTHALMPAYGALTPTYAYMIGGVGSLLVIVTLHVLQHRRWQRDGLPTSV